MRKVEVNYKELQIASRRRQREIAKKMDLSDATISYLINDERPITLERLNKIAEILDTDTMDFLTEKQA